MKKSELRQIIKEEIQKLNEASNEKTWAEMSDKEKKKAYKVAIDSGDVKDSFDGFSKMMQGSFNAGSIFNVKTGEPIEVSWK